MATVAGAPTGGFPRLKPDVFVGLQFTFLAVGIVAVTSRTVLRVIRLRRVALDDIFLVLAMLLFSTTTGIIYALKDLSYLQMNVSLGLTIPRSDFSRKMERFVTLDNVASILVWASVYSIKLSSIMFFRKFATEMKYLGAWWWIVLSTVIAATPTCMFLGFSMCSNMTPELFQICASKAMARRETIYLAVTTSLDIFTDLLVISIPIALLWRAKIDLRRKLALGTILSLSIFMIIVSIIRVALAPVSTPLVDRPVADTLWLFFWQSLKTTIAIVMASLMAFPSMLGQELPSKGGQNYDPEAPTAPLNRGSGSAKHGRKRSVGKEEIGAPVPAASVVTASGGRVLVASAIREPSNWREEVKELEMLQGGDDLASARLQSDPKSFV